MSNFLKIPPIDALLKQEKIQKLMASYKRDFVVAISRQAVAEIRQELKETEVEVDQNELMAAILNRIVIEAEQSNSGTLRTVINGTGVILHTNLGRAPLGERACKCMLDIGHRYNNLEMDLEKGERGSRYYHVEKLLTVLTGAEAALVVNNNAAAVMLGLTTLAQGKEVIVSRGQLVEIGGAFRIPEVMKLSGAQLIEVGTTNKTYISDYARVVNDETSLLFSAHTSNYKIVGFTAEVSMQELVSLGEEREIPVMMDLGSGILTALDDYGLRGEPTIQECVRAGVDIITFSGDKLLGGPQAGIIVGKKKYIEAMKKNQLLRALRVDKLILAALEGTLLEYLSGNPYEKIPIIHMLSLSKERLEERAKNMKELLLEKLTDNKAIAAINCIYLEDMVGGGAYPTYTIPGVGIEIEFAGLSLDAVSRALRLKKPALVTRRQDNKMLISVRTLLPGDDLQIMDLITRVLDEQKAG